MKNEDFEKEKAKLNVIYDYIRGSHAYGLNTETSDIDTSFVYIAPMKEVVGLRANYREQIADEKSDNVGYEVGRYLELLEKSNPTMLESLFIPDRCIRKKSPIMDKILAHRNEFLSKEALKSFSGYAYGQIKKARGLGKKIVNPVTERKLPIDFCYTFNDKQGTEPIVAWLDKHGLKQIYCGLNHLQNMDQMYGVFYDIGQHIHMEYKTVEAFKVAWLEGEIHPYVFELIKQYLGRDVFDIYSATEFENVYANIEPKGYHGVMKEDGSSCDIHLDSIVKGDLPICYMSYNEDGYQSHCRQYKEYKDWEKNRNQARYEGNLGHNYDSKNMSHCIRLLTMSLELARDHEFNVDRTNIDREHLLAIKKHQYEYEEVLAKADELMSELDEAIKTCDLPDKVDHNMINKLLIDIRRETSFNDMNIIDVLDWPSGPILEFTYCPDITNRCFNATRYTVRRTYGITDFLQCCMTYPEIKEEMFNRCVEELKRRLKEGDVN